MEATYIKGLRKKVQSRTASRNCHILQYFWFKYGLLAGIHKPKVWTNKEDALLNATHKMCEPYKTRCLPCLLTAHQEFPVFKIKCHKQKRTKQVLNTVFFPSDTFLEQQQLPKSKFSIHKKFSVSATCFVLKDKANALSKLKKLEGKKT
ncbi:UNVERIFIED_CONTAM: hypothetical protein K2H54_047491 [Gekko kuhli]